MSSFSFLVLVLIAMSCQAFSNSLKGLHQATKKVDLVNHIGNAAPQAYARQQLQQQREQQLQQQHEQLQHDEARQKRSESDYLERQENSVGPAPQITVQDIILTLIWKLREMEKNCECYSAPIRTPRVGRSIDFQLLDAAAASGAGLGLGFGDGGDEDLGRQFLSLVNKKSVQYKPRLGKRAQQQQCD